MIIKIQISQNEGDNRMLIYNADRSVVLEFPTSPEVLLYMNNASRAYFHAEISGDRINILDKAPVQTW